VTGGIGDDEGPGRVAPVPTVAATGAEADGPIATATGADGAASDADVAAIARGRWRRRWADVRFPVLTFCGLGAVLYLTVWASNTYLSRHVDYPIHVPLSFRGAGVLEGWVRFDGGWYRLIATQGYGYTPGQQSSVAFWPSYPLAMRALGLATGDVLLAGILLTFACGLGTAVLFYRWCCRLMEPASAKLAVVLLLVFPYAWYLYGAVYADALFLVATIGAFVLLERDRPVLAGLVAAVATAARPVGMGVVIGLVVVMLDRRGVIDIPYLDRVRALGWRGARRPHTEDDVEPDAGAAADGRAAARGARTDGRDAPDDGSFDGGRWITVSVRRLRLKDAGVLLSLGGFVAWVAYLWLAWGSPTIFADIQGAPGWDQGQGPATWFKAHWLGQLHHLPDYVGDHVTRWNDLVYTIDITVQGLLAIGFILLIPLLIRRIGWSYAVYVLAVVAIPIVGTKDWQGTGRYLLAAFPVFAALADWLVHHERRSVLVGLVGVSAAALLLLTSMYARGYYLS
jgi:hypothetical protein